LPMLKGALQRLVSRQIHVVRDFLIVIDAHGGLLLLKT
jgi:hypothetical protein